MTKVLIYHRPRQGQLRDRLFTHLRSVEVDRFVGEGDLKAVKLALDAKGHVVLVDEDHGTFVLVPAPAEAIVPLSLLAATGKTNPNMPVAA